MARLNWGIIGAGNIARSFANGVAHSKTGTVLAVASRSIEKARKFASELNIPRGYGSYQELLADKDVQAVYIATPHPMHAEWAIRAAQAGKHILCEQPIGINHAQTMAIIEAAREHDVFLMEAFMYRCHPQTHKLVELLKNKAVGEVRLIQASFGFHANFSPQGRLFANELAGGGILDVGCYCTSGSRLVAGLAVGKEFAEPLEVQAVGHLGVTGVDEWSAAVAKFPGDIVAELTTSVSASIGQGLRIFGSEGHIVVPVPWMPLREGGRSVILVHRNGQEKPKEIVIETGEWLYGIEADTVAENLTRRQASSPAMTWDDTLGNMKMLDSWRQAIGLCYESEQPGRVAPLLGHAVKFAQTKPMQYGKLAGIDKPISRLGMGVYKQDTMPQAAVMFDEYVQRGGNCFDTAYVYGGGKAERLLGHWVKSRDIRKDVVILDKGAHTPFCTPEFLSSQFIESLDRLQMDYADIYMMHRDNPKVPVGEFIDVLNEHVRAGRMRVFGGSNWSLSRVQEANEYARKNGLQGFGAISNNFSLARMVEMPWVGCVNCKDKTWQDWLTQTQTPVFPWSSQAGGFFARGDEKNTSDAALVRCWYSPDNFQRLARAKELAAKHGVEPIVTALAFVLSQSFSTFPLIGPQTLEELRISCKALTVTLTQQEVAWLDLQE